ncbi:hypothetical protein GQ53DRAFT_754216 [Thozetella sp. PMI_491]|nr:hypothetical protein GQ53DRAFT_754216 [Thozetella sp. PMI_491]
MWQSLYRASSLRTLGHEAAGRCLPRGYATLSAIHKGLHRSQRARPQGFRSAEKPPGFPASPSGERTTYKQRQNARAAMAKEHSYKIRRGKKDITERPGEARPKSRAARFNSKDDSFGSNSLVYQLKKGNLREELRRLESMRDSRAKAAGSLELGSERRPGLSELLGRKGFLDGASRSSSGRSGSSEMRRSERGRGDRSSRPRPNEALRRGSIDEDHSSLTAVLSRGKIGDGRPSRSREARRERSERQPPAWAPRERERSERRSSAWAPRERERSERQPSAWAPRERERTFANNRRRSGARRFSEEEEEPSLPFTTAASQFLYGTSVVKAALQEGRRKLYKLYIYAGPNRQNLDQDVAIQQLAERKRIQTELVYDERIMAKLSEGRPHNGYLLETSPLPQPPILGLGSYVKDGRKVGYELNLAWQSAEESAVNGNTEFVQIPSETHKPLVVVLDQVKDPGNLGAILRTVKFLGGTSVAISKGSSASLTAVAMKASAGASEMLNLYSVSSVAQFLDESREKGWKVYAAAPASYASRQDRHLDLHQLQDADPLANDPCILLIGNEGEGLSKGLKARADFEINIPNLSGSKVIDSLNVSVATGLLCSAFFHGEAKAQAAMYEAAKLF